MPTITRKELIERIAEQTKTPQAIVREIFQKFLDEVINELGQGNRLEFRDFGVFEPRSRKKRVALNPKTLERLEVPAKRLVKFKLGRLMKQRMAENFKPPKSK